MKDEQILLRGTQYRNLVRLFICHFQQKGNHWMGQYLRQS